MWLMNYITQNSLSPRVAESGGVKSTGTKLSVDAAQEHKEIKQCLPYGLASVPPVGESAVVLPLDNGEVSLGVIAQAQELEEGEIMLYSKGGATLTLKNDGTVLINGSEVQTA